MPKTKEQQPLIVVGEEQPAATQALPAPAMAQMSFDAWWLLTQSRLGLKPALKESLKNHMSARGFLASKRYDDGLKDFGIRS